jgi:citrate synthase
MDKQIFRLIGKATTLAAYAPSEFRDEWVLMSHSMAYRVRQGRNFVEPPTGLSYTGS